MRKFLRVVILLMCIAGFCFSGMQLYTTYREYKSGEIIYDSLAEQITPSSDMAEIDISSIAPISDGDSESSDIEEETEPWYLVEMEELLAVNSDVVGWIRIYDSNINYPILQAENNAAYLRTTITGEYNRCGCIFVDSHVEKPFKSASTLIFGHNLMNNKMFGDLMKYEKSDWLKSHGYIFIQTLDDEVLVYQVYSCYRTSSRGETYTINLETGTESYRSYLNYTIGKSQFASELVPTNEDTIITLSTCTNATNLSRFVVHAVLLGDVNEMS